MLLTVILWSHTAFLLLPSSGFNFLTVGLDTAYCSVSIVNAVFVKVSGHLATRLLPVRLR